MWTQPVWRCKTSVFRLQNYLICNRFVKCVSQYSVTLELQTFQMLIRDSAQTTQAQTCFPEQLLGSWVACQSQTHGDACQCGIASTWAISGSENKVKPPQVWEICSDHDVNLMYFVMIKPITKRNSSRRQNTSLFTFIGLLLKCLTADLNSSPSCVS